jgi:hypothetical protein
MSSTDLNVLAMYAGDSASTAAPTTSPTAAPSKQPRNFSRNLSTRRQCSCAHAGASNAQVESTALRAAANRSFLRPYARTDLKPL